MIKITDVTNQTIWARPDGVVAILIPSALGPGDGKCRIVIAGGVVSEVTRAEAERVVAVLSPAVH